MAGLLRFCEANARSWLITQWFINPVADVNLRAGDDVGYVLDEVEGVVAASGEQAYA
jgi:hypothetical protein